MPDEPSTPELEVRHRFDGGLSWGRAGNGLLECRSHALRVGDDVWLIDPIDGAELEEMLAELGGEVVGVIVLLDRHLRDSVAVAARHDARLLVPPGQWRRGHPAPDDAEQIAADVSECPFSFTPIVERSGQWLEWALWWPERRVLVVPEAVGTPAYYLSRSREPLAVHPVLRVIAPPHALAALDVEPDLLLVGHGQPLERSVRAAIELAVEESRRELPWYLLTAPRHLVRWGRAAVGLGRASC